MFPFYVEVTEEQYFVLRLVMIVLYLMCGITDNQSIASEDIHWVKSQYQLKRTDSGESVGPPSRAV